LSRSEQLALDNLRNDRLHAYHHGPENSRLDWPTWQQRDLEMRAADRARLLGARA